MASGDTHRGELWTVRRQIVPWLVSMSGAGDDHDVVHRLDQSVRLQSVRTKDHSVAEVSGSRSADDSVTVDVPWYATVFAALVFVMTASFAAVNAAISFAYWCVFALISLVLTPVVLGLRVTRVMRWRIDVRVDGVLVDKRFVRGGLDTRRLIEEIGRQLSAGKFCTTDPSAVGPDSDAVTTASV